MMPKRIGLAGKVVRSLVTEWNPVIGMGYVCAAPTTCVHRGVHPSPLGSGTVEFGQSAQWLIARRMLLGQSNVNRGQLNVEVGDEVDVTFAKCWEDEDHLPVLVAKVGGGPLSEVAAMSRTNRRQITFSKQFRRRPFQQ